MHHRPALCIINHGAKGGPMSIRSGGSQCSSVPTYTLVVHNVILYRLGGAQDDFACSSSNFLMVYNAVVSLSESVNRHMQMDRRDSFYYLDYLCGN